jgi:pilus assembly protein Flp/PilA
MEENMARGSGHPMKSILYKIHFKLRDLLSHDEGQDLVEYALVVALIAFGAVAGMKTLSTSLNTAFGNVSTKLGSYVS